MCVGSFRRKRCLLEVRVSHHQPIVVKHHDNSIHQAIETATEKLMHALEHMTGKLHDRTSIKNMYQDSGLKEDQEA